MDSVFLKLLNMSITASYLVAAVLILRLVLKKAPRWIHCLLWAMVALRLAVPVSFESVLSLIPSTQSLPGEVISGPSFDVNTGIDIIDRPVNDYLSDRYFEGVMVPANHGSNVMTVLSVIWLLGMAAMVAYAAVTYLRLRKKVAPSIVLSGNVHLCDYIDTPFILGIAVPKIYLPTNMDAASAAHVLAHERAHIARKDHWWKPLGFALLTLHWFNPILWLAYVLLCRDIELACDEKVVKELGSEEKKAYSEALLQCSVPRHMIAACPLAFGEVGVKERVKSVLNYKKPAFWLILIAIILCVAVAVCFLTDPVSPTLDDEWNLSKGSYTSGSIIAGDDTRELTAEAEIRQVTDFLKSARVNPEPISNNRVERASDYEIILSDGASQVRVCFDIYFTDVWMYDGMEPSYPYSMKDPGQVKEFFETMLGKVIPDVSATVPDNSVSLNAVILRVAESSILAQPVEDSAEGKSADQFWVNLPENAPAMLTGDVVTIVYDGMIAESYPAQIHTVYSVSVMEPAISDADLQQIADKLGTAELKFFDVQSWYGGRVIGCQYGSEFGLVYFVPDGNGGWKLDSVLPESELIGYVGQELWHHRYDGKVIYIINDTQISALMQRAEEENVQNIFHYPCVLVFDDIEGAEYQTMLDSSLLGGYIPSDGSSVECVDGDIGIKLLTLYDDWEYEVIESKGDGSSFGIQFRPKGEDDGWITIQYFPSGFGVCGTGLQTVSGSLPYSGYLYSRGHYDGSDEWSFLAFQGKYRDFAVTNGAGEWFSKYQGQVMTILSTVVLTVDK